MGLKSNFTAGDPIPASWYNRVARLLNNIMAIRPIEIARGEETIAIGLEESSTPVPVKITGPKSGDYYPGDVYQDGTDKAATDTGVDIYLNGWDVDTGATQGWMLARQVTRGTDEVYEVLTPWPRPPAAGDYYLRASDGKIEWIEAGTCT